MTSWNAVTWDTARAGGLISYVLLTTAVSSGARPPEPLAVHPLAPARHERAARLRVAARARVHRRPRHGGRSRPVHAFRPLGRPRAVREPLPPRLDGPRHRRAVPAPRRMGQLASASPDRTPPLAADPRARLRRLRGGDAARPRHRERHTDDLGRRPLRDERRPRRLASRPPASGAVRGATRVRRPLVAGAAAAAVLAVAAWSLGGPFAAGLVRRAREGRQLGAAVASPPASVAPRPARRPPTAVVHVPFTARYAGRLTVEPVNDRGRLTVRIDGALSGVDEGSSRDPHPRHPARRRRRRDGAEPRPHGHDDTALPRARSRRSTGRASSRPSAHHASGSASGSSCGSLGTAGSSDRCTAPPSA